MAKKGGNNAAAEARADEQQRQARVREGTSRIDQIFSGTGVKKGVNPVDPNQVVYDGSQQYYDASGNAVDMASRQLSATGVPQFYSNVETTPSSGFNDAFFDKRKQAYIDYADPQLEQQYGDAQKELTYALARAGLLDSSVRAEKTGELQRQYDLNKQQIADQGLSYSTDARNNVEKARGDLVATLNATGDAEGAANSALARSSALSAPQAFSPLTQLFADFTNTLGTQAAFERATSMSQAYGGAGAPSFGRYNTGLFGNSRSVVNTR